MLDNIEGLLAEALDYLLSRFLLDALYHSRRKIREHLARRLGDLPAAGFYLELLAESRVDHPAADESHLLAAIESARAAGGSIKLTAA